MYSIILSIYSIIPEITICFGAMLLLIIGAYSKDNNTNYMVMISITVLLLSIYSILSSNLVTSNTFNNMLQIDNFTQFIKILLILSTLIILLMILSINNLQKFIGYEFIVMLMLGLSGMMLVVSSNNMLILYMGLELVSLSSYILVASNRSNLLSSEAGVKYFIMGAVASGLLLFGISLVYGFAGSINFNYLKVMYNIANIEGGEVLIPKGFIVGMALILIAISFKLSAAPFHMWTPDVYQGAPTIVTTLLSTVSKLTILAIFIKLLFSVFINLVSQWQHIILIISILSMFVGSIGAIMQKSFKRLIAYSSIGHMGFALIGIASLGYNGVSGTISYMMIYLTMNLGLFACLLLLKNFNENADLLNNLSGLSRHRPYLAFIISIFMLSMAGIPPFAGFFAKLYVFQAAINNGMYILVFAGIMASVIAAFYYLRVIKIMYFEDSDKGVKVAKEADRLTCTPTILGSIASFFGILNILYIIYPDFITQISHNVAMIFFR